LSEKMWEVLNYLKKINNFVLFKKPRNSSALKIQSLISSTLNEPKTENLLNLLNEISKTAFTQKHEFPKKYLSEEDQQEFQDEVTSITVFFKELKKIIEFDFNHEEIELELAHFGKT